MSGVTTRAWSFTASVWRWKEGSWRFVTVPEDVSDEVDEAVGDATGGFGSVRVEVTVGSSVWRTSLFPSTQRGGLRAAGEEGGARRCRDSTTTAPPR